MIEHHIDIPTRDGQMPTFVVHPDEGGPHPVVLFYMDAPGKREELHDMARRIAAVGYCVVLPNLYYRRVRAYELAARDDASMKVMFEHMASLSNAMIASDTDALMAYVDAQPAARKDRVGAVGYCMSGPFVVTAAAHEPRLRCIASIYGANMVTDQPDSPHRVLDRVRCETYIACAEIDRWAPPETVATLKAALDAARVNYRLEWFPGAHHGFAFPLRAGIYDKPSAERHWVRLFDLFRRNLQS